MKKRRMGRISDLAENTLFNLVPKCAFCGGPIPDGFKKFCSTGCKIKHDNHKQGVILAKCASAEALYCPTPKEEEIVEAYKKGLGLKALARLFSVSKTQVRRIVMKCGALKKRLGIKSLGNGLRRIQDEINKEKKQIKRKKIASFIKLVRKGEYASNACMALGLTYAGIKQFCQKRAEANSNLRRPYINMFAPSVKGLKWAKESERRGIKTKLWKNERDFCNDVLGKAGASLEYRMSHGIADGYISTHKHEIIIEAKSETSCKRMHELCGQMLNHKIARPQAWLIVCIPSDCDVQTRHAATLNHLGVKMTTENTLKPLLFNILHAYT